MPLAQSTPKAKETQIGLARLSNFRSSRMLALGHGANRDGMMLSLNIAELHVYMKYSN